MGYTQKQVEQRRRGMIKHRYKLTVEQYDAMLDCQDGVCAICHQPPFSIRLSVDHDHSCCAGRNSCGDCIRGLICQRCNAVLGYLESNDISGHDVQSYLDKYTAKWQSKMAARYGTKS